MFERNQIKTKITKYRYICECKQCLQEYECNIYDANRSKIGHLCNKCKTQITSLVTFSSIDLNKVFNYDKLTGIVYYKNDSISGLKGEIVGHSHNLGYLCVSIGKKEYLLHRIIWYMVTGNWPDQIDHIDHNRSNNKWENLRDINSRENQLNMKKDRKNNSTGVTGVRKLSSGKFHAYIMINRKQIHLGHHNTLDEAQIARKKANELYGFHKNHGS